MARYIDAKKVKTKINYLLETYVSSPQLTNKFKDALASIPAADVVPKSEVERLQTELDVMRGVANSFKMHYENLAREIFEEIDILGTYNPKLYAELKKKYTEPTAPEK